MRAYALIAVALVAGAACYDTPKPTCAFLCGEDSSCPASYFCASDGWCKLDGTADGLVCEVTAADAAVADGATSDGPDASAVDAGIDAVELDAPTDAPVDADPDATPAALSIISASPVNFGSLAQTQFTSRSVLVHNGGDLATSPITVAVTGAQFAIDSPGDTCSGQMLAAGDNCEILVRFTATTVGTASGVVSATATSGGAVSSNLTGVVRPLLNPDPTDLDFGDLVVGQMATLTLSLINVGLAPSGTITIGAPTGAFTITDDGCDGTSVPANGACTIDVRFLPTATGAQMSTITVTANPGGPRTVTLTGTGQ